MNEVKDQPFEDQRIELDFNHYIGCRFTDCELVYHGAGPTEFTDCEMKGCEFALGGHANNTLVFLNKLVHGTEKGEEIATGFVEAVFGDGFEVSVTRKSEEV